jgi:hypothetical protein
MRGFDTSVCFVVPTRGEYAGANNVEDDIQVSVVLNTCSMC